MFVSPDVRPQPLRNGILKLQALDHLHVGHVRVGYRGPGAVYVEPSLGQWSFEAFIAFGRGDDDMWLAIHEATGLFGADFANGEGRGVGGG